MTTASSDWASTRNLLKPSLLLGLKSFIRTLNIPTAPDILQPESESEKYSTKDEKKSLVEKVVKFIVP